MKKRNQPIFRRLLIPLMILVLAQLMIFAGALGTTRVAAQATERAVDVTESKLTARKNYLESIMINNWMNVSTTVTEVNGLMEYMISSGQMTADEIGISGDANDRFLAEVSSSVLDMMRSNRVTGGYVLLCRGDLADAKENGKEVNVPGIYLRDLDPSSVVSDRNTDILIERSPASVVKKTGIATDTLWQSVFRFSAETGYYPFFYEPYETAYEHQGEYEWRDLGYWSAPYSLAGDTRQAIGYSVPLLLEDGSVYGVLGLELTLDYLNTLLPSEELIRDGDGTYFIALANSAKPDQFTEIIEDGSAVWNGDIEATHAGNDLTSRSYLSTDEDTYWHQSQQLEIYSSNVPFDDTEWVMGAIVPWKTLQENADRIRFAFAIAAGLVFLSGVIGSVLIAYTLQRPVRSLEKQLRAADSRSEVHLDQTGICEIDEMSQAIEKLSADVLDAGRKFSKIIQMSSEALGGFQIDESNETLFVTDRFFDVFGYTADPRNLSVAEFRRILDGFAQYITSEDDDLEGTLYEIDRDGKKRYARLRQTEENGITYGLAEDVTSALLRRRMLVFERDHDSLTGLLNRKAFQTKMSDILENGTSGFAYGALLMLDLDNLKTVNDTYGHEYGDEYIRTAGRILADSGKQNALVSRISGDEFNVFYYGNDREEIEERISALRDAFTGVKIRIGSENTRQVRISAGIAWYPQDGLTYEDLQRYADSAMYIAKKHHKGEFETFDMEGWQGEGDKQKRRDALVGLLEEKKFHYAYQPIVSAKTGEIYAYEALLRPDHDGFSSPMQILEAARSEGKLGQVENTTVPVAIKSFMRYQDEKKIGSDVRLFFNTISNQLLSQDVIEDLKCTCKERISSLVMEITEEEPLDYRDWEDKVGWLLQGSGHIALDDYGTGYNSEKSLLSISPDFIKVDIAIVRNIQNSSDQRTIMEYIVNFAHERGKMIIAEGVEDEAETRCCIALGADLLQGYYVSRPQEVPKDIDEELKKSIISMHS